MTHFVSCSFRDNSTEKLGLSRRLNRIAPKVPDLTLGQLENFDRMADLALGSFCVNGDRSHRTPVTKGMDIMNTVEKSNNIFGKTKSRNASVAASTAPLLDIRPPEEAWEELRQFAPHPHNLEAAKMVAGTRTDPAHVAFDVLRTRMTLALKERGWHRVGITSPTRGCGKSFTAANLAISFSRQEEMRTVLMDMDLNSPTLARYLGAAGAGSISEFLSGGRSVESHFMRAAPNSPHIGSNLALGLNEREEMFGSELIQYPTTEMAINEVQSLLDPDVMLFDLPPVLSSDVAVAMSEQLDCILIVVSGEKSKAEEIREAERIIAGSNPVLGIVMNQAKGSRVGN